MSKDESLKMDRNFIVIPEYSLQSHPHLNILVSVVIKVYYILMVIILERERAFECYLLHQSLDDMHLLTACFLRGLRCTTPDLGLRANPSNLVTLTCYWNDFKVYSLERSILFRNAIHLFPFFYFFFSGVGVGGKIAV